MCKWFCTSTGPATALRCVHCGKGYCRACLHSEGGKMESLIKCASCGKKPATLGRNQRREWTAAPSAGGASVAAISSPTPAISDAQTTASFSSNLRPEFHQPQQTGQRSPDSKRERLKNAKGLDRLTDPSLYTGSHKSRFDSDGKGLGLAGRDSVAKGRGHVGGTGVGSNGRVNDLSDITRSNLRNPSPARPRSMSGGGGGGSPVASAPSPKARSGGGGGSGNSSPIAPGPHGGGSGSNSPVKSSALSEREAKRQKLKNATGLSRLTDPSLYTGAHRNRFDSSGRGRGAAGRDSGGIDRNQINDLSQLTRN